MSNKKRRRSVSSVLGLPAELMPGVPRVLLRGNDEVSVENHAGLKSYARDCVELQSRNGFVRIRGDELELGAMLGDQIIVRGFIVSIELC